MQKGREIPSAGKGVLSNIGALSKDPLEAIMRFHKETGPVMKVNLGFRTVHYVADEKVAQAILQTRQKSFRKGTLFKILGELLGNGLLNAEGEEWKKHRKLAQPAFHKKYLDTIYDLKLEQIQKRIEQIRKKANRGEQIRMDFEMTKLALDVVVRTLLGSSLQANLDRFNEAMEMTLHHIMERFLNPVYNLLRHLNGKEKLFKHHKAFIDQLIVPIIEERMNSEEQHYDLLGMLMSARDEETGEPMSLDQLRDEIVTIFLAGHETTANAMTWTIYLLAEHPEILQKLRLEIDTVLGDRNPTFEDTMRLPYTRQVIDEAMRLYPPAWMVTREAIEEMEIEEYCFPKDGFVLVNFYGIHRNEEYWPESEKFDPDRFTPEKVKERPKFHFIPFGAGPRMCIGNHFAYVEMMATIALMVREFDFEHIGETPKPVAAITLRPEDAVHFNVKIRAHEMA